MVTLAQLWLPILLSSVLVFFASSILHMVLKFWHMPDCSGFSNEDEVGAAMRKGNPSAGMYMIPYCKPEAMKEPQTQEKFKQFAQTYGGKVPHSLPREKRFTAEKILKLAGVA